MISSESKASLLREWALRVLGCRADDAALFMVEGRTAHRTPAGSGRSLRAWRSDAERRLEDMRHPELAHSVRLRATVGSEVDSRADLACRLTLLSRHCSAHDRGREHEEAACNSTPSMPINTLLARYSLR
jgi:hypothetical protein